MAKNRKNVILLVIDSLNYNRLGFSGAWPSPSPTIDALLASGLTFTNYFTTGCPTQFSLPTMLTSTMPLDKGGYTEGVNSREVALAEVFRQEGYATAAFYTDVNWVDYERGFDDCFALSLLSRFSDWVDGYNVDYYARLYRSGQKSVGEISVILEPFLKKVFRSVDLFCAESEKALNAGYVPSSFHRYDYEKIKSTNAAEKARFRANPQEYMEDLLSGDKTQDFFFSLRLFNKRATRNRLTHIDGLLRGLLLKSFFSVLLRSIGRKPDRMTIREYLSRFLRGQQGTVKCFSGAYVFDTFFNWIRMRRSKDKPFFAWVHLSDIHDLNFVSYDSAERESFVDKEVSILKSFYRETRERKNAGFGNPLFDFAIKYEDGQVARLLTFLEQEDLLKDTLIVLTSDHGNITAAWPPRSTIHPAADFYDELYHVPLAFIHKEIKPRTIHSLCSSIDIAPTILDLLQFPSPPSFQGESLARPERQDREFVIMEHLGPGPCDFTSKPINVCVRSKTHKLVYQQMLRERAEDGLVKAAYNLEQDPDEKHNIARETDQSKELQNLLRVAKERVSQIKKE